MLTRKASTRRALWLGILILLILISLIGGTLWSFRAASSCFLLSEKLCEPLLTIQRAEIAPAPPARPKTDEEIASLALSRDILSQPRMHPTSPKLAFMFLTRGPLPHERIWERFFRGHEGMYSVFVHASEEGHSRKSMVFKGRDIHSKKVGWGKIDMIDAERRLLANALLEDRNNEYFVLLSESCIPLWSFDYVYEYFLNSSISYVDCFYDPGPHGAGRYLDGMKPEVERTDFSKGAQWFAVNRRHALLIVADSLYYRKFAKFCKPGDEFRNCYPDEHYVQTLLHIIDPQGISNWSVTHVDWRNQKWHPRSYKAEDINLQLIREIQNVTESLHVSSDSKKLEFRQPCLWNGLKRPCFLFARKFMGDTTDHLADLLFSSTV
ncbi:hypothetical protein GOP47_0028058 [Adiantum capillus-veneris]|nr:hypothetical protein GOP47_0028058 [Adiantum capillus-veneris]